MTLQNVYKCITIDEVIELLNEYKDEAKIIAGGTDVIVAMMAGKLSPKVLIDVSSIEELKEIKETADEIEIGAATTYTQIIESDLFTGNMYGLNKACQMVASPQIRNKGTIGGNIANASPAADSIPPLIALGASLKINGKEGSREVLLEDYCRDKGQYGLKPEELLLSISFPKPKEDQILSFSKLGLRKALAISRITLSMLIGLEDDNIDFIRVASGSIGKFPMRETDVEEAILGKALDDEILKIAVDSLQQSMDNRLKGRATLPYKRTAIISLLEEALKDSQLYYQEVRI